MSIAMPSGNLDDDLWRSDPARAKEQIWSHVIKAGYPAPPDVAERLGAYLAFTVVAVRRGSPRAYLSSAQIGLIKRKLASASKHLETVPSPLSCRQTFRAPTHLARHRRPARGEGRLTCGIGAAPDHCA